MREFLGEVGMRYATPIVFKSYIWRRTWGNNSRIYLLEDRNSNIITIRSTAKFQMMQEWIVDGTVKHHKEFNGQPQTHLSDWSLMLKGVKK